jgi:streptogramin lyase/mono/diheme cytochrome c family protein
MRGRMRLLKLAISVSLLGAAILFMAGSPVLAQGVPTPANLSGQVTADQGVVRAFRVKARDTLHRVSFMVYTVNGRYRLYNLPPGPYEVQVVEQGFESPMQHVDLKTGGNTTVDLVVRARSSPSAVELVDYDKAYPPGPGREALQRNCTGCHGRVAWLRYGPHTEEEWRAMVGTMFDPNLNLVGNVHIPMVPVDDISPEDLDAIVKYLATNHGPDSERQSLKKDELVRDEDALSKALYIEYELPTPPSGNVPEGRPRQRGLHSPAIDPEGMIYWSGTAASDSILRLDPHNLDFETRTKEWVVPTETKYGAHPDGIIWLNGKVYFSELGGNGIGELDPKTGEIVTYATPTRGGAHTLYADSKGNIWYTVIRGGGGRIGRLNLVTHKAEDWSPVYGAIFYGLIVDKKDRVWACGLRKSVVVGYDPKTEKFTPYYTPSLGSGPRRLTVDSKDRMWFSEYYEGNLGTVDASTGKMTEYKYPLKYTTPYDLYPDSQDNIWASDDFYESMIKFDQRTKKFTYYPFPLTAQVDAPKIEGYKDGTMWFYPRGRNSTVVEAFQPTGNTPQVCYPWMRCATSPMQAKVQ